MKQFKTVVTTDAKRRVMVPVPFDADDVWGTKSEHRVAGTVNGLGVRAVIEPLGDGSGILLGPAWRRGCGIGPGDEVEVVLAPEGPHEKTWPRTSPPPSTPSQKQELSSTLSPSFTGRPI